MDMTELTLLALHPLVGKILSGLYVALGLGLVIFFHELGHFAVAKWCNVYVERFSIGFGPVLWSFKKGETEYALSLIPFGGYVKMLGQDDMDPSQLSSEEIAEDPRAYSSKSVAQRMAIISAGVIMNIITGMIFFALAFGIGVQSPPAVLGYVHVGDPAWVAGLEYGDRITGIRSGDDDAFRRVDTFMDIIRGVALTSGDVTLRGEKRDGGEFQLTIRPDASGTKRMIGADPLFESLRVADPLDPSVPVVTPQTPAARAKPPFQPGDVLRKVGDRQLSGWPELQELLAQRRDETLDVYVQREGAPPGELVKISVAPQPFRTLGLWMDIGRITALQDDSPAAQAGLKVDDRILRVDGKAVGTEINPLWLPDYFAAKGRAGESVELEIGRPVKGGDEQTLPRTVKPTAEPGWVEQPLSPNVSLSAPAVGVAYEVLPAVMHVEPGSPAAGKIRPDDRIKKMELVLPKGKSDPFGDEPVTVTFGPKEVEGTVQDWAHPFWLMQTAPTRTVRLTVSDKRDKPRTVELQPEPGTIRLAETEPQGWFIPDKRGLRLDWTLITQEASGPVEAVKLGLVHTRNTAADIYLTLRSLFRGDISPTELSGPVGIAKAAYSIARNGLPELLLFLGLLSVNLAVLNFLPIPVLDGGHMVFLIWEGVTRRKPSERVVAAATYAGLAFVLGLMLFVLYLDLFVHGAK